MKEITCFIFIAIFNFSISVAQVSSVTAGLPLIASNTAKNLIMDEYEDNNEDVLDYLKEYAKNRTGGLLTSVLDVESTHDSPYDDILGLGAIYIPYDLLPSVLAVKHDHKLPPTASTVADIRQLINVIKHPIKAVSRESKKYLRTKLLDKAREAIVGVVTAPFTKKQNEADIERLRLLAREVEYEIELKKLDNIPN